ncbi:MAG: hypothetical protein ACM3U2_24055 [Deltaproteobacteria bacterium]
MPQTACRDFRDEIAMNIYDCIKSGARFSRVGELPFGITSDWIADYGMERAFEEANFQRPQDSKKIEKFSATRNPTE